MRGTDDSLAAYLADLRTGTDAGLERVLAALAAPPLIVDAMRYSVMAGGKRLRPCITLAAAEAVGARTGLGAADARARALPAAVAIEMIHSYSLIHDDLPAMDDDALRRGRPTLHVVSGDGLAILAGDGLLTEAFNVLASSPSPASLPGSAEAPAQLRLRASAVLSSAAGAVGMVGGQAIDLAAAGKVPGAAVDISDARALEDMHARKTGALIRASAVTGAILTGGAAPMVTAIDDYARELGLAFQIIDDVLDVEGSSASLGKTAGKDAAAGKPTYPARYGIAESRRLAAACVARATAALDGEGIGGRLAEIAAWSLTRQA
ncbi:MAG TPA: farnesyl diphosphate synthase [Vicinamibacterales bacterium]|nr:farnesyl diphosphate synthase [Vicinamibacterales bacterium]